MIANAVSLVSASSDRQRTRLTSPTERVHAAARMMAPRSDALHGVMVAPPFGCRWLEGPEGVLRDGQGCLSFEVKGTPLHR